MAVSPGPGDLSSTEEKLRFIFNIYDTDGNGEIDRTELRESLRSQIKSTGIHITEEKLQDLTASLFDTVDGDGDGGICFKEFKTQLEKYPDIVDKLTDSASKKGNPKSKRASDPYHAYFANNIQLMVFLGIYFSLNIIFFVRRAYQHYSIGGNGFYIVARACGHCLNFNGILVLVLMLRKSISFLRATFVYYILPFDHTVALHKFIGVAIAVFALGHTIAHIGNGVMVANESNFTAIEFLLTDPHRTTLGLIPGTAFITGWLLIGFLIVLLIGAMPFVRDSGYFQVFNWTHFICYTSMFVLYIMHGPHFWKWFIGPALIYLLEKLSQSPVIKKARYGTTYVKEARLLPSRVTNLVITRPEKMQYRAGDYIFVLIPAIAKYEWHPFTISSAPEQEDITLHIQSRGTWTRGLYSHFSRLGLRSMTQREKHKKPPRFEKLTVRLSTVDEPDLEGIESAEAPVEKWHDRHISRMEFGLPATATVKSLDANRNAPLTKSKSMTRHESRMEFDLNSKEKMKIYIQGPYGTPSTSTFSADHAVLIGGGIGVTPFASIIQSIVCKYRRFQTCCPNCNHTWTRDMPAKLMKIKKVDFIWINRSPTAFEWFVKMLSELEEEEEESSMGRFFDIHLFMTAMRRDDVGSVALQLALDAAHTKYQKDALTGLRTKLQPGRPDFEKLFQNFRDQRIGKIEIFFCGSPQLGKTVKFYCTKFGFPFHTEVF